jgi:hypothetical protein
MYSRNPGTPSVSSGFLPARISGLVLVHALVTSALAVDLAEFAPAGVAPHDGF